MTIVVYTQPTSEPVSIAECKAMLQLDEMNFELPPSVPTVALAGTPISGNAVNGVPRYAPTFATPKYF